MSDSEGAFEDRTDAAEQLSQRLLRYRDMPAVIVIGLPRGGVPMAKVIADALHAPVDLIVPRKIGHPSQPECALGALTEFGEVYWNEDFAKHGAEFYGLTPDHPAVQRVIAEEREEAARRKREYRQGMAALQLQGKIVIVVDDGIATGATMKAAILSLRKMGVDKIVVAIPVGPPRTIQELRKMTDEVVCLAMPRAFHAVGQFYEHFDQTSDDEVMAVMREASRRPEQSKGEVPGAESAKTETAKAERGEERAKAEGGEFSTGRAL